MAKKPIIEIDLDDAKFKEFYDLFKKYQEHLDKSPSKFDDFNKVMASGMGVIVDNTHHIAKALKEATKAQHQFQNATRKSGKALGGMAKDAKELSSRLFGIGRFLLKGGLFGVGAIGGGLFGIDRLASDAVSTQRTARGYNVNTGQYRAFKNDFKRITLPSVLGTIANAQQDTQGLGSVMAATRMPLSQIESASPAKIWWEAVKRLRLISSRWNKETAGNLLQALGYTKLGINLEDWRRIMKESPGQLSAMHSKYEHDKTTERTGRSAVHNLYTFQNELQRVSTTLGTVLQKRLSALAPSLTQFIKVLGVDATKLLTGLLSPANLKVAEKGLNDFTQYLTSGKFKMGVDSVVTSLSHLSATISTVSKDIHGVFEFLHPAVTVTKWIAHGTADVLRFDAKAGKAFGRGLRKDVDHAEIPYQRAPSLPPISYDQSPFSGTSALWPLPQHALQVQYREWEKSHAAAAMRTGGALNLPSDLQKYRQAIIADADKYHIPPALLAAHLQAESGGNPNAINPVYNKNGQLIGYAKGIAQMLKATAREYGVTNRDNPFQEILGAAHLIADNLKRFGGDYKKEIAAYNTGAGNVAYAVRKHGPAWENHLHYGVKGYVKRVSGYARAFGIRVVVPAGAHVATQANGSA